MWSGPVQKFFWSTNRFFGSDFISTGGGVSNWRISAGLELGVEESGGVSDVCARIFRPNAKRTRINTLDPITFANCRPLSGRYTATSPNFIPGPLDAR